MFIFSIASFFWKFASLSSSISEPNVLSKHSFLSVPFVFYQFNGSDFSFIDSCIHRSASLSSGHLSVDGCLVCPYHGWSYWNGSLNSIPGVPYHSASESHDLQSFKTVRVNNDLFFQPVETNIQHPIYVPPEASLDSFSRISGQRIIDVPSYIVTDNLLDMMHISFVHSFGNPVSPVPFHIHYEDLDNVSGKTSFHYNAASSSMSKIIGGADTVIVENEFHLPDATVTRVIANHLVKTIVTHALPITQDKTILFFDLYRNFLTNSIFDFIFDSQMKITLDEDVKILQQIHFKKIDSPLVPIIERLPFNNKFDITQIKYKQKCRKWNLDWWVL